MIYLAVGRRERGKTTAVYFYARKLPQRIIIDPRRQFDVDGPRVMTPEQIEESIDRMFADKSFEQFVIVPRGNVQECFDAMTAAVETWMDTDPSRPLAIIVDEAQFFDLKTPSFNWILRCAPRSVIHVFLTAHRPKDDEIPIKVQSIADQWMIFHTTQKHDLATLADACSDDVADRVSRLKAYEWVQWDSGKGEMREHTNPREWFTPLRTVPGNDVAVIEGGKSRAREGRLFG